MEAEPQKRGRPSKLTLEPVQDRTDANQGPTSAFPATEQAPTLRSENQIVNVQTAAPAATVASSPATKPWEPASRLNVYAGKVKIKDSRYVDPQNGQMYRVRFCSKAQLARKQGEGWEILKSPFVSDNGGVPNIDGAQIDTTIQKPDLILCRMPEEMAISRNEYFQRRVDTRIPAIKISLDRTIVAEGGRAYNPHARKP